MSDTDELTTDEALGLLHATRAYWTADMMHACAIELGEELEAMLGRDEITEKTYEAALAKLQEAAQREKGAWAQSQRLQTEAGQLMQVFGLENVLICMTRNNPSVEDVV